MTDVRGARIVRLMQDPGLPHANHGGILAKHFPRIDWPRLWKDLDPTWVQHPEREAWPKPDLRLVLGKGLDDRRQSSLSLVPSGGER